MVDIKQFHTQMEAELRRVDDQIMRFVKDGVKAAYTHIMSSWPTHTYYSGANNIVTMGQAISQPTPEDRPTYAGAMQNEFYLAFQSGLDIIDRLKAPKRGAIVVTISNPVSYAADVGFDTGKGIRIYEEAAVVAVSKLALER